MKQTTSLLYLVIGILFLSSCTVNRLEKTYQYVQEKDYTKLSKKLEKIEKHKKNLQIIAQNPVLYNLMKMELAGQQKDSITALAHAKYAFFKYIYLSKKQKEQLKALGINEMWLGDMILVYNPPKKQVSELLAKKNEQQKMLNDLLSNMEKNATESDLLPKTMDFNIETSGTYGEHINISFEYGQDIRETSNAPTADSTATAELSSKKVENNSSPSEVLATNTATSPPAVIPKTAKKAGKEKLGAAMPGFKIGAYSSLSADNALRLFVQSIEAFIAKNPTAYSNVSGSITGYADAIPIGKKGLKYGGEVGTIPESDFYAENTKSKKKFAAKNSIDRIKNNEELAFVRAYYAANKMGNSAMIDPSKIAITTHVSDKTGINFRKVVINLQIQNAYKHLLNGLHDQVKEALAETIAQTQHEIAEKIDK